MMERSFYEPARIRPGGLMLVIGLHAAALLALALAKGTIVPPSFPPTRTYNVPLPVSPEPVPVPPVTERQQPQQLPSVIDLPRPMVETPSDSAPVDIRPSTPIVIGGAPVGPLVVPEPPQAELPPAPPPVRVEAQFDPRYRAALQPPYPPSEQRLEREGSVQVRLAIGADGRVGAVTLIRATSDAFWQATRAHALRQWRFRPATEDGRPVPSERVMTVTFVLE